MFLGKNSEEMAGISKKTKYETFDNDFHREQKGRKESNKRVLKRNMRFASCFGIGNSTVEFEFMFTEV
jgi:hypothetical protein